MLIKTQLDEVKAEIAKQNQAITQLSQDLLESDAKLIHALTQLKVPDKIILQQQSGWLFGAGGIFLGVLLTEFVPLCVSWVGVLFGG